MLGISAHPDQRFCAEADAEQRLSRCSSAAEQNLLKLSEEQNPRLVREIRKTVKQLQELYFNMDSVCTIQFEKGGNAE